MDLTYNRIAGYVRFRDVPAQDGCERMRLAVRQARYAPFNQLAFAQRQEFQHLVLFAGQMHARTVDLDCLTIEIDT